MIMFIIMLCIGFSVNTPSNIFNRRHPNFKPKAVKELKLPQLTLTPKLARLKSLVTGYRCFDQVTAELICNLTLLNLSSLSSPRHLHISFLKKRLSKIQHDKQVLAIIGIIINGIHSMADASSYNISQNQVLKFLCSLSDRLKELHFDSDYIASTCKTDIESLTASLENRIAMDQKIERQIDHKLSLCYWTIIEFLVVTEFAKYLENTQPISKDTICKGVCLVNEIVEKLLEAQESDEMVARQILSNQMRGERIVASKIRELSQYHLYLIKEHCLYYVAMVNF